MATQYSLRGKTTGIVYHEFDTNNRGECESAWRSNDTREYQIVEREIGPWKVSTPEIYHHYKRDGSLVISFENGPVEFSPEVVTYLKTAL